MRRSLPGFAAVVLGLLALLAAGPVRAGPTDYDALDEAAKAAIKTACHGWIFEDAANRLAGWLDAVSPLCDAEEQARLRALNPVPVPEPSPRPNLGPDYAPTDFGSRGDRVMWLRGECENDYMCTRMRQRAIEAGRPVTMDEYRRIADRCEGEYWCIEKVFEDLPDIEIPPAREGAASSATPPRGKPRQPDGSRGGRLFEGSIRLEGRDPATVAAEIRYRNLAPVHLSVGPVELEMRCSDGSGGRAFAGGTLWLAPGEAGSATISGERTIVGQSCPTGIESYRPTGVVRHLQAGISGYDEQVAVCPDGRRVALVLAMADAQGRRYAFHAGDGRVIEVDVADYDARLALGRICGTGAVAGARREFIADGTLYLSRDHFTLMEAWSRTCAADPASCTRNYAAWAATRPAS